MKSKNKLENLSLIRLLVNVKEGERKISYN